MEARVKGAGNPDLTTAIQHLHKAIAAGGVDRGLLSLVHSIRQQAGAGW